MWQQSCKATFYVIMHCRPVMYACQPGEKPAGHIACGYAYVQAEALMTELDSGDPIN